MNVWCSSMWKTSRRPPSVTTLYVRELSDRVTLQTSRLHSWMLPSQQANTRSVLTVFPPVTQSICSTWTVLRMSFCCYIWNAANLVCRSTFYSYLHFIYLVQQKLPHPTDQSPSPVWKRMLLIRKRKEAMMSGNKWVPETRLPSLAKLTLSAHPSLIFLVDTSGTLRDLVWSCFR